MPSKLEWQKKKIQDTESYLNVLKNDTLNNIKRIITVYTFLEEKTACLLKKNHKYTF